MIVPELEKTLIYVQGKKPRSLPVIVPEDGLDGPFVRGLKSNTTV